MSEPREVIEARRDQALADLRELDAQVAAGEVRAADADDLRGRYATEALDAMAALEALATRDDQGREDTGRRRVVLTVVSFTALVAVSFAALVAAVEPRPPGGFITGGVAADAAREGGVDLSRITTDELAAVVTANPEVVPMRLALARRHVEAGDYSAALPHYFEVLEREANHPEALMYLGWMSYTSGEAVTGVALLEHSLSVQPDNVLAMWFLANALYYGLDDMASARPLLEAVVASPDTPAHIREIGEDMLSQGGAP